MIETIINKEYKSEVRRKINKNFTELFLRNSSINWVNVLDYNTKGDGLTDDTVAIQSAINSIKIGGILYIPNGIYMIKSTGDNPTGSNGGLMIEKSMTVILEKGAELRAIDGQKTYGQIIKVLGVTNFELYGGKFVGDKDTRVAPCENCNLLLIEDCSNIHIHDTIFTQTAGDGIRTHRSSTISSKNILINNCHFDNFSRWGISLDMKRNMTVRDCRFSDGNGEYVYGGGIDVEYECTDPDTVVMKNITIDNCRFENIGDGTYQKSGIIVLNPGSGSGKVFENALITGISMEGCARGINLFNTRNYNISNGFFDAGGYTITARCSATGDNYGSIIGNKFVNGALLNVGDSGLITDYVNGLLIVNNDFDASYIRFNFGVSNNCIVTRNIFRNLGVLTPIDVVAGHTANGLYKDGNMDADNGMIVY